MSRPHEYVKLDDVIEQTKKYAQRMEDDSENWQDQDSSGSDDSVDSSELPNLIEGGDILAMLSDLNLQ